MFRYIKGMSEEQKNIARKLKDCSWEIDRHIIKLLFLPDCQESNHWKREIARFLSAVDRLKGKNKWPKSSFIFDCLSTHNDVIDELAYQVWYDLKEADKRYLKISTIQSAIEDYQQWISEELSKNGVVKYDDIYNKLEEIINHYD